MAYRRAILWAVSVGPMLIGCGQLVGVGSLSGGDDPKDGSSAVLSDAGVPIAAADGAIDANLAAEASQMDATSGDLDGSDESTAAQGCDIDGGLEWVSGSVLGPGFLAPSYAVPVGNEQVDPADPGAGVDPIYVCRGYSDDGGPDIVPGKFVNSLGCYTTPDGVTEVLANTFDLLADYNGCTRWTPYSSGAGLPSNAIQGGQVEGYPVYICGGAIGGDTRASGYTFGPPYNSCWVSYRGGGSDLTNGLTALTE